jgi:hypothetical protein
MDVRVQNRAAVHEREPRKPISTSGLDRTLNAYDAREEIARVSRRRPNEKAEVRAFLESKRRMIRSHPHLTSAEKARALADVDRIEARVESGAPEADADGDTGGGDTDEGEPPLPGGVGFGVFYRPRYRVDFDTGTAAEYTILCPTRAGGDVHGWLYLTAMNRASRGPEAFVAYEGQQELVFLVFDWARTDRWQVSIPYSGLQPYLRGSILRGEMYQALRVLTLTFCSGEALWTNEVYLENAVTGRFALMYAHDYVATKADQQFGWDGSWGPIIETFQNRHRETEELGFADFSVTSRRSAEWDEWERLSPADTYVVQDDAGFRMIYLSPNHTFLAAA